MALILASGSPRRKELMGFITDDFLIRVSDAEENINPRDTTAQTVMSLALAKGEAVAKLTSAADTVVSADTVVEINGSILGKPHSPDEARYMLKTLSGATHRVYTGVCVIKNERKETFFESTDVTFFDLSDTEIDAYIETGEPFDKAGAYGIQGKGALLVKEIKGDFYTVMGLPVGRLSRVLKRFETL